MMWHAEISTSLLKAAYFHFSQVTRAGSQSWDQLWFGVCCLIWSFQGLWSACFKMSTLRWSTQWRFCCGTALISTVFASVHISVFDWGDLTRAHTAEQKNRTGLQAQMWFLLTVSYKTFGRVTPTQICPRLSSPGHTFMYLVKLIPPNSTHSDSLLKGHIGKPLVLIMLYSHPYLLSCRLITIHSLVSMWVCVAFSVWPHVCVCLRVCVQQTTRVLRTVMNHFHCNGFGAPQSPPPPPHSLFMRKSIAQAPPFIAAHPCCGVLRVCEPCQRNGIEFCAVQIKWDWIE